MKSRKHVFGLVIALLLLTASFGATTLLMAQSDGWSNEKGGSCYYSNGSRVTGWNTIDGIPYYFNASGYLVSTWGIDVSEWQGTIDWNQVKADGCGFAIIRVGGRGFEYGALYEDCEYATNLSGAIAAGIPVGVYFYSEAISTAEAIEEADYVLDLIDGYDLSYPVCFDYEDAGTEGGRMQTNCPNARLRTDICLAFCNRIEQAGYDACVYSFTSMLNDSMYAAEITAAGYDIWFAYLSTTTPGGYSGSFTMWQYSWTGNVAGIDYEVDMDVSVYDYAGTFGYHEGSSYKTNTTDVLGTDYTQRSTVRPGSTGVDVVALQNGLNELGYDCGLADGDFGSGTSAAVMRFQSAHSLDSDAIVGQATWKALYEALLGKSSDTPTDPEPEDPTPTDPVEDPTEETILSGVAVANRSTIRQGSTGSDVVDMQKALNALGYNCGNADGAFGSGTASAVKKFQAAKGLDADAIVGQMTWKALYAALEGTTTTDPTEDPTPTDPIEDPVVDPTPIVDPVVDVSSYPMIYRGCSGQYVVTLQNRLNALGYNCGTADGIFGSGTASAVMAFQAAKGLGADGYVGQLTWKALMN